MISCFNYRLQIRYLHWQAYSLLSNYKQPKIVGIFYIGISVLYAFSNPFVPSDMFFRYLQLVILPFTLLYIGFFLKSKQVRGANWDMNNIPNIFKFKLSIALISCLMTGEKTFKEVKVITGATDGNLSINLSKLEVAGYIEISKDFFNNKPRTRYKLTKKGEDEFIQYVNMLDNILKQYREHANLNQ
jgi:DNA-binding MarR family transcriptional regulator